MEEKKLTGYPSIDKPWLKYYTEEAINAKMPECTVYEYLWENNKDHLDDIALHYFDQKITYAELFMNIEKAARAYSAAGVRQGDIVTMCSVSTPETIYTFYALSRLGAISNLIDLRADIQELKRCIVEAESTIVVSLDLVANRVREAVTETRVKKVIIIAPSDSFSPAKRLLYKALQAPKIKMISNMVTWSKFLKDHSAEGIENATISAHDAVLMTHTSGTTGHPKGVLLSNHNINAVAFQYALGMPHSRQQKYLAVIPPFIAFGICVAIHLPLGLGMTCIPVIKFDPSKFYDYLKQYRPNHFTCTPSNLETLIKDDRDIDLSDLCVPSVGGDYIGRQLENDINQYLKGHRCNVELIKGYGMTEVSSSACTTKNGCNKYGSVGFPLVKMTISIFEPGTDKELVYGEEGEICFTGPNMMLGYFKNKVETDKLIKMHGDGSLWVHSGDIGYMDEDGFLFVIDRLKRMIYLSNGVNLLPSKVERKLTELPGIVSCAVVAHKESDGQTVAKVYVVTKDKNVTEHSLLCYCHEIIPEEYCVKHVQMIEKMPLTPVGKVDYRALEKEAEKE